MILRNKNFWIVVTGLVIAAVVIDVYFVRKYQEVSPPLPVGDTVVEQKSAVPRVATTSPSVYLDNAKLAGMSVTQELATRWGALVPPLDIATAWNPKYMRWENDKGYILTIPNDKGYILTIPTEESVAFAQSAFLYGGDIVNTFFSTEMQVAREVFERRGFALNHINSSTSTSAFAYDYVQAYEKGDEHCAVVVNLENTGYSRDVPKMGYILTAMCGGSIAAAEREQIPLLRALEDQYKGMSISEIRREGDFVVAGAGGERGGFTVVFKKERAGYRVVTTTQEDLRCEIVDKEKIPLSVLKLIGSGTGKCFESNGQYRQVQ